MFQLKDSLLIFIMLVFTSKYMLYSVTGIDVVVNLLSIIIGGVLLFRARFHFFDMSLGEKIGALFFIISFLLLNFAKVFNELTMMNAIVPTGVILIIMLGVIYGYSPSTLRDALRKYSVFNAVISLLGLIVFFMSLMGVVHSETLVHAEDHANQAGYISLYGLAYYPSWINLHVLSLSYYRYSGVFWEPGTLGLYMVFLITVEIALFLSVDSLSKYRIFIFLCAGLASLSLLFVLCIALLFFCLLITRINHKKFLLFTIAVLVGLLFVVSQYYDYLYQLVFYRMDFDSSRGFVGNNRSGAFSELIYQFSKGTLLQQLIGFGPYSEFLGDSTSFIIKIYQRGVIGSLLLLGSFLSFLFSQRNYFFIPAWGVGLLILCQFEGAIYFIMIATIVCLAKRNKDCHF
jgi:hypothetical protein